ncbi:hypothetical protein [Saccharothrix obliqua]|uniref:hypothetical protein n=1 Tax=Saccharothrix obliqua TaxID=2861747 RepID=UPI001C5DF237|nr:hypothetical protein [Saccharothrix obliqua]MBW4716409.1 hypothetical protein [Saccharothrix obliqua]
MAQRIRYGKVVLLGLFAGGLFGAGQGVLRDNVWVGLIWGAVFGLVMALVFRRVVGSSALRGLDFGQRRVVSRALRRGVPVEDARLARPLVEQADVALSVPYPVTVMRVVLGALGLLGVLVSVLGFLDEGVAGLGGGVPLVLLSLVFLFVVVPLGARQRERVRRSRDATRDRYLRS